MKQEIKTCNFDKTNNQKWSRAELDIHNITNQKHYSSTPKA